MLVRLDSAKIQWLRLPNHLQNLGLYWYIPQSQLSVLSHLILSQWTVLGQRTNQENPKKWLRSQALAKGKQINWRHVTSSAWLGPYNSFPVSRIFLQEKLQFIDGENQKISSDDTCLNFRTIKMHIFFMLKLLQYCNYIIIVVQIKLMLLLLLLKDQKQWKKFSCHIHF